MKKMPVERRKYSCTIRAMKVLVCNISAIEMWSRGLCQDASPSRIKSLSGFDSSPDESIEDALRRARIEGPVHVMAQTDTRHRASDRYSCHVWKGELPPRSVCRLDDGWYAATVEFCFLQLSYQMSLIDLIMLGDELCGTYASIGALKAEGHAGYGFYKRPPLTTPGKLRRFLEGAGLGKRSKAVRAANYVAAMSRSPMESAVHMLLCLPPRYGGYSLPAALLNVEIKLPAHVAKATGIDTLHPDLYWPDSRIAVEYKGKKDHSEEWHRTNDAIRENALKYRDVTVLSVTKGQFASITGMYAIAKEIADMMGRRVRLDIRAKAHIDLHRNLCDVAHLRQVW